MCRRCIDDLFCVLIVFKHLVCLSLNYSSILIVKKNLTKKDYKIRKNDKQQKLSLKEMSKVLYRRKNWSGLVWLLCCWRCHCFRIPLIFLYCWSQLLLPRRPEVVDWLSHISRVRRLGIVHFYMFCHFLHHLQSSELVLCVSVIGNYDVLWSVLMSGTYERHMMFVEILSHFEQ